MCVIISLFDESGNALLDWAAAGYECHAFDILNDNRTMNFDGGGSIKFHRADLTSQFWRTFIVRLRPLFVMGFPPCTDLAVSGAAHFERKRAANPAFQLEAVTLARLVETIGLETGTPWFLENPVSVMATIWRKPNYRFDPYEFGGYLPENDKHPRWPQYILARDAYPKRTCLWTGNGYELPPRKPVDVAAGYSNQHNLLGGKSARTKQIRSETPRGFARANFVHYNGLFSEQLGAVLRRA